MKKKRNEKNYEDALPHPFLAHLRQRLGKFHSFKYTHDLSVVHQLTMSKIVIIETTWPLKVKF